MSEYKPGVLIHNYNEDQFGEDLVKAGKATFPTPVSITHTAYRNPKAVAEAIAACGGPDEAGPAKNDGPPRAVGGMPAHLLFGHSGDMRNTDGFRQKAFISSSQYFFQDPKVSADEKGNTILTTEKFYESNHPVELSKTMHSCLAQKTKDGWNYDKNPYASIYDKTFDDKSYGLEKERLPRVKGEFTRSVDSVRIHRNITA